VERSAEADERPLCSDSGRVEPREVVERSAEAAAWLLWSPSGRVDPREVEEERLDEGLASPSCSEFEVLGWHGGGARCRGNEPDIQGIGLARTPAAACST
jgi:hypothetical protein